MVLKRRGSGEHIRVGDMTHQVRIRKATQASDSQGGRTGTPTVLATVWANINPIAAARAQAYGMTMNNQPMELDMVYDNFDWTLDEDDTLEVVETGQILYVHSVVNVDMANKRLKLLTTEKR